MKIGGTEEQEFDRAVNMAMVSLQYIAGQFGVCPACFCEALIEELHGVAEATGHGRTAAAISVDELWAAYDLDDIGRTEGSA